MTDAELSLLIADRTTDFPAIFPRGPERHVSDFLLYRVRRNRARRVGPENVNWPARLPAEYRLAQIDQAVAHGWQGWEIAALVPGPVSNEERARALR